ncbi:MAG: hypothetical protein HC811_06015 [Flammeovirgaceae bacterium]|nr:hypothetical protein [Flammeovirgaceae bacterium]
MSANTYTVSIDDVNLCGPVTTANIIITEPAVISITGNSSTNVSCNGGSDGSITVTGSGGTGPLSYTLNPGAVTNATGIFPGLSANTYTVSIDDVNSCGPVTTANILITEPAVISITGSGSTNVTCNAGSDGSITITGAGGTGTLTYTLNPGAVSNITGLFTGLPANIYTVAITDANACGPVTTANIIITEPSAISITGTNSTNVTCNAGSDGSITVTGTGGTGIITYTLNPGAVSNITGIFSGLAANTYTVSIDDAVACGPAVTGNIVITEPAALSISGTSSTNVSCNGGSDGTITVIGAGGTGTLTYTLNPGAISNTTGLFTGLAINTYTVSIDDANACGPVTTANIVISQPTAVMITSVNKTDATCLGLNNGAIQINSSGGTGIHQYSIDNGANFQASNTFINLVPGVYNAVAQDANGCLTPPTVVTINNGTPISITSFTSNNATCVGINNGSIVINTVTGGATPYQYSINGGTSFQASNSFPGLAVGSYDVVARDVNSCLSNNITIVIVSNTTITFTATPNDATCLGVNDGSIVISGELGGTGPYTYSIDNGAAFQASPTFTGLAAASFDVIIRDVATCLSATSTVVVGSGATITPTTVNVTDASCGGVNDGAIDVAVVTGGTAPYTYSIDNGTNFQAAAVFSGLIAAPYDVVVRDVNGCLSTPQPFIVAPGISVSATITSTDATCIGNDGSIVISGETGGAGPYTYSINNGVSFQAGATFNGLLPGVYEVVIREASGCLSLPVSTSIALPPMCGGVNCGAFTVSVIPTRPTCIAPDSGSLIFSISGGSPNYTLTLTMVDHLHRH